MLWPQMRLLSSFTTRVGSLSRRRRVLQMQGDRLDHAARYCTSLFELLLLTELQHYLFLLFSESALSIFHL